MKKTFTHHLLHTINNAGVAPDGESPLGDEENMNVYDTDPELFLNRLSLRVPDRVMRKLFLRIRIFALRNRN